MASASSGAAANAANLALRLGSNVADAVSLAADLGQDLPGIGPVLNTLQAIREKVETVKNNREELKALEERCTYFTACVVIKFKKNRCSQIDVTPLETCVANMQNVVKRCSGRRKWLRALKASSDKDEIAGLNARVSRLVSDLGNRIEVQFLFRARTILQHIPKCPIPTLNSSKSPCQHLLQ